MPAIIRPWKRFLVCSCSHGQRADGEAIREILKFKRSWKPHATWHLGDFLDLAAMRSGAKGSKDEAENLEFDLREGMRFLKQLEPQKIFKGNHEHRGDRWMDHHNSVKSLVASHILQEVQGVAHNLQAEVVPYDIEYGWRPMGDMVWGHGYSYGENALEKHATSFGKCGIGHLHVVATVPGYRIGHPAAYCVGTLANIPAMAYARQRFATLRWSMGWAWGEYCDGETVVRLHEKGKEGWRSPL